MPKVEGKEDKVISSGCEKPKVRTVVRIDKQVERLTNAVIAQDGNIINLDGAMVGLAKKMAAMEIKLDALVTIQNTPWYVKLLGRFVPIKLIKLRNEKEKVGANGASQVPSV